MSSPNAPLPIPLGAPYKLVQARHGWFLANPNDFYLGRAMLEYGEYGEIESAFLRQLLFKPGRIVEVGANIGTHTVGLAKEAAARGWSLDAFEPQPFIFQNLCANLALNGIANARAWPLACGNEAKTVFFSPPDYGAIGNFGGVEMTTEAADNRIAVPCVRLDDLLGPAPVGLMKIDVEGFELLVLQGAAAILERSRPILYVENDRLEKSRDLIEFLWSMNYRLWWHGPQLFNPDNFFKVTENIYGNVISINMFCIPRELEAQVNSSPEVTDSAFHPMANSEGA